MSSGEQTTDHETIRKWAEKRGGRPSRVKDSAGRDGEGILRFDFGEKEPSLEPISWDDFFRVFEERKLALIYQDQTSDGKPSRFSKFVSRQN